MPESDDAALFGGAHAAAADALFVQRLVQLAVADDLLGLRDGHAAALLADSGTGPLAPPMKYNRLITCDMLWPLSMLMNGYCGASMNGFMLMNGNALLGRLHHDAHLRVLGRHALDLINGSGQLSAHAQPIAS